MPQICYFYGITVYIQFMDHNPPHIHVVYQGMKAQYKIENGELMAGKMSNRAHKLIQEWIEMRKTQLNQVWNLASTGQQLFAIEPLD